MEQNVNYKIKCRILHNKFGLWHLKKLSIDFAIIYALSLRGRETTEAIPLKSCKRLLHIRSQWQFWWFEVVIARSSATKQSPWNNRKDCFAFARNDKIPYLFNNPFKRFLFKNPSIFIRSSLFKCLPLPEIVLSFSVPCQSPLLS